MKRRGFNQADAARFFGWHESVISQYLSGERVPNLDNAVKIETLTGIQESAWLSSPDDESAEPIAAGTRKPTRHKA